MDATVIISGCVSMMILSIVLVVIGVLYMTSRTREVTIPSWAVPKPDKTGWSEAHQANVDAISKSQQPLDIIMYGDSITAFHSGVVVSPKVGGTTAVWKKHFGQYNAIPAGIRGDQIGTLIWRIAKGGEKPAQDPKVVILLIGVNDLVVKSKSPSPIERYDALLQVIRSVMPTSKIIVMALLPAAYYPTSQFNTALQPVAEKYGATWVKCGWDMSPSKDKDLIPDFIHPNAAGHERILTCLKPYVEKELRRV